MLQVNIKVARDELLGQGQISTVASSNFHVCTHVNFTRVNKIEIMSRRSRVNVKGEPRSTFTFTHGFYTLPLFYLCEGT